MTSGWVVAAKQNTGTRYWKGVTKKTFAISHKVHMTFLLCKFHQKLFNFSTAETNLITLKLRSALRVI